MKKKKGTTFVGDFSRLAVGGLFSSVVGILVIPVLTRMYDPASFGLSAMFFSIASVLAVLACLRYEVTIVLPDDDGDAANILVLSVVSTAAYSLLLASVIYSISGWFESTHAIFEVLWVIPVYVFLSGLTLGLSFWSTRAKHFTRLSVVMALNKLSSSGLKLIFAFLGLASGLSLITAMVLAKLLDVVWLLFSVARLDGQYILRRMAVSRMMACARRYKKFPIYGSWSILLGVAAWQLPLVLLGLVFSPVVAGYYSLAFTLLEIPMSLVGRSLGQVFYQRASELESGDELASLVHGLFIKLVLFFQFPMLMLVVIGGDLYAVVFGESWRTAGEYVQVLSVWAYFWFLSAPFTKIFSVLEMQKNQLVWNAFNLVFRIIAIAVGWVMDSVWLAVILLAVFGSALYMYKIYLTLKVSGVQLPGVVRYVTYKFMVFGGAAVLVGFVGLLSTWQFSSLLAGSILTIVYLLYAVIEFRSTMIANELK